MAVFMIVGKNEPIYELSAVSPSANDQMAELSYLHQFILHSSLDLVASNMWSNNSTFLKVVDRFNSVQVSAYVTPGGAIFLLLHSGKNEDAVRGFFTEVHDIYVKYLMNPFSVPDAPIISPQFDICIRNIAKRALGT